MPPSRIAWARQTPESGASRRRLVDDGVARDERAARRAAAQREREVEGADDRPDAVRLEHGAGVHGWVAEVAHGVIEAVVLLDHVARPADQVGRLLDVAECLEAVLANLDGKQRGEHHLPLADDVGHAAQDRDALAATACRTMRERRCARGRDGVLHVLPRALGERTDECAVDRRALLERPLAVALLAADDVAMALRRAVGGPPASPSRTARAAPRCRAQRGVGDLQTRPLKRVGHWLRLSLQTARQLAGLRRGKSNPAPFRGRLAGYLPNPRHTRIVPPRVPRFATQKWGIPRIRQVKPLESPNPSAYYADLTRSHSGQ